MSSLTQYQKYEAAMTYAALLLKDAQKDISADNLEKVAKAAGVDVQKYWVEVFSKFLTTENVSELIEKLSSISAAPAGGAVEEKKEEPTAAPVDDDDSSSEGGMDLFGDDDEDD